MQITMVGLDLEKDVFQIHGLDAQGKILLRKQLRRAQVAQLFVNLPPCLIGMKACGSTQGQAISQFLIGTFFQPGSTQPLP